MDINTYIKKYVETLFEKDIEYWFLDWYNDFMIFWSEDLSTIIINNNHLNFETLEWLFKYWEQYQNITNVINLYYLFEKLFELAIISNKGEHFLPIVSLFQSNNDDNNILFEQLVTLILKYNCLFLLNMLFYQYGHLICSPDNIEILFQQILVHFPNDQSLKIIKQANDDDYVANFNKSSHQFYNDIIKVNLANNQLLSLVTNKQEKFYEKFKSLYLELKSHCSEITQNDYIQWLSKNVNHYFICKYLFKLETLYRCEKGDDEPFQKYLHKWIFQKIYLQHNNNLEQHPIIEYTKIILNEHYQMYTNKIQQQQPNEDYFNFIHFLENAADPIYFIIDQYHVYAPKDICKIDILNQVLAIIPELNVYFLISDFPIKLSDLSELDEESEIFDKFIKFNEFVTNELFLYKKIFKSKYPEVLNEILFPLYQYQLPQLYGLVHQLQS